jgi:quercetin dioxygenase-like cupin family protein
MRIYRVGDLARQITHHGSVGARVQPLASPIGRAFLVVIELDPQGVLGWHEATENQLFVVVAGSGWVRGGEGPEVAIESGMAAYWTAGEMHETRAGDDGLRAIVLEGEYSDPGAFLAEASSR